VETSLPYGMPIQRRIRTLLTVRAYLSYRSSIDTRYSEREEEEILALAACSQNENERHPHPIQLSETTCNKYYEKNKGGDGMVKETKANREGPIFPYFWAGISTNQTLE
jgi:hypothetical protein